MPAAARPRLRTVGCRASRLPVGLPGRRCRRLPWRRPAARPGPAPPSRARPTRRARRCGQLMERLRPRARQPPRPRDGGDAMITRRTKVQLLVFVLITLLGVSYVGARYARLDRLVVDDTTRSWRTSRTPAASSPAPRSPTAGSASARSSKLRAHRPGRRRRTSTSTTTTTRSRPTRSRWSATARPSASSTSSSSRRSTRRPTSRDGSRDRAGRTPAPRSPTETLLTHLDDTVESVDKPALQTTVTELGTAFDGTGRGPRSASSTPATRSSTLAERELRHHRRADPRQQHRAARARSTRRRAIKTLRPGPVAVQRHPGRLATTTCARSSTTARRPPPQLRTFLEDNRVDLGELINNLVTTGEVVVKHLDGVEQLLVIYPYVVEGGFTVVVEVAGHRAVRRPLRHDPHPDPAVCHRATRAPTGARAAGRQRQADGHDGPLHRAAVAEQRPRRAERARAPARPTARRSWRRTTRHRAS